jgi:hypothetical protein
MHAIFQGEVIKGEPILNPNETSAENIAWLSLDELKSVQMYPSVALYIEKHLQGQLTDAYIGVIQQDWI